MPDNSPLNKANSIASMYSSNMGGATYGKKPKDPSTAGVDDVPDPDKDSSEAFQKGMGSSPLLQKLKALFGQG